MNPLIWLNLVPGMHSIQVSVVVSLRLHRLESPITINPMSDLNLSLMPLCAIPERGLRCMLATAVV